MRRTRAREIDIFQSHCGSPRYGVSRGADMCRNIKTLANFAPPATDDEIRASALQFVRKLSGTTHPSRANAGRSDLAENACTSWPNDSMFLARPGGGTGRHAVLRGQCRKASRFESEPGHGVTRVSLLS